MTESSRCLDPVEVSDLAAELLAKLKARSSANPPPEALEEIAAREARRSEADREAHAAQERVALARWKGRLQHAAPISRWECAWEPKQTEAIAAVEKWLSGGCKRHLVMFGGVGCGKSVAAAYAVKAWVKSFERVSWLTHDQLVSAVLHSYDDNAPRVYSKIVIDDMGRERNPQFADALCDLLDRQDVTILITSNLTTPQFKERYTDARLLDRLNDSCVAVRIKSPSLRAKNGGF